MKKLFEEDDNEHYGMEKARILAVVIPIILILLLLALMLIKSWLGGGSDDGTELQQSIMDYADENKDAQESGLTLPANSTSATSAPGADSQDNAESEAASAKPSPVSQEGIGESQDKDMQESGIDTKVKPGSESISSPTPYKEVMEAGKKDYSKIAFHKEEQLRDMMAYWEDNNQKALNDLVYLDHYIAMSYSLHNTTDFYYYGDWKDGERNGEGTWFHYHIHLIENKSDLYTYHQYTGGWAGDLPDGEGSEHYDYDKSLLQENTSYVANLIGSYAKGLVNGKFYLTSIYADDSSSEWNAEARNGVWNYQNDIKDPKGNRTVYVDVNNPDNYTWMHPKNNVNIGVPCLLSKNRDKNEDQKSGS